MPLSEEILYIQSYIDLHQLRYNNALYIQLELDGDTQVAIPALILITFVENAFKHGDLTDAQQPLKIRIYSCDDALSVEITNKKGKRPIKSSGGIGIENIRKRLQLYYPERFTLEIYEPNECFDCHLKITAISHAHPIQV